MHCCFLFVTRNKESWHRGYSGINIDDTTRQPTRDTAMNAVLAPASRLAASQLQPGSLYTASAWPSWLQGVVLSSLPPMCCSLARCCCIPIEPTSTTCVSKNPTVYLWFFSYRVFNSIYKLRTIVSFDKKIVILMILNRIGCNLFP